MLHIHDVGGRITDMKTLIYLSGDGNEKPKGSSQLAQLKNNYPVTAKFTIYLIINDTLSPSKHSNSSETKSRREWNIVTKAVMA